MRGQGDFTTARSDLNAARGDSESPTRAALGAELARRGRVLSERGKVGKGAERKVKNHFIDHSYHFIPNALTAAQRSRSGAWRGRWPRAVDLFDLGIER